MSDVTEQKALTENYANAIWAVADLLHGPFNDDEYGEVILPFVLLRRFECVLQPTRKAVLERSAQLTALKIFNEMQTTVSTRCRQRLCVPSQVCPSTTLPNFLWQPWGKIMSATT